MSLAPSCKICKLNPCTPKRIGGFYKTCSKKCFSQLKPSSPQTDAPHCTICKINQCSFKENGYIEACEICYLNFTTPPKCWVCKKKSCKQDKRNGDFYTTCGSTCASILNSSPTSPKQNIFQPEYKNVHKKGKKILLFGTNDNQLVKICNPIETPKKMEELDVNMISFQSLNLNTEKNMGKGCAPEKEINEDPDFIQDSKLFLDKEKMVGKGTFGAVFFGTLFGTIPIAVKKIYKVFFKESGLKELEIFKKLNSKHVVKYYGYSENEDFLFIILEQMDCNLSQYLSLNPNMELKRKIEILLEVSKCIDCLHQQKIIHLDVKPSNFLLIKDGSLIKIADFGISKLKKTDGTSFTNHSNLGTIGFQAPELCVNNDYGPHSDIYSFGIMMFEILFGISPYTHEEISHEDFKKSVRLGKRPNLEQFEKFDEKLTKLVELMTKCWDSKKNNRPNTEEIIEFLNDFIKNSF
jgi:hypothetical protein